MEFLTVDKLPKSRGTVFASRIKQMRTKKGLTQVELASLLKVNVSEIGRWETGRTLPNAAVLLTLSNILDVSIDYMAGIIENPKGHFQGTSLSSEEQRLIDARRRGDWRLMLHLIATDEELKDQPPDKPPPTPSVPRPTDKPKR